MDLTNEVETALAAFCKHSSLGRDEAIKRILKEWLQREGFMSSGQEGIPPHKLNASNDD